MTNTLNNVLGMIHTILSASKPSQLEDVYIAIHQLKDVFIDHGITEQQLASVHFYYSPDTSILDQDDTDYPYILEADFPCSLLALIFRGCLDEVDSAQYWLRLEDIPPQYLVMNSDNWVLLHSLPNNEIEALLGKDLYETYLDALEEYSDDDADIE